MAFGDGLNGLRSAKESNLNDALGATRNILTELQHTANGSGEDAKHARDIIRWAVTDLKKMVNSFTIAEEPSGVPPSVEKGAES